MRPEDIIKALRCSATPGEHDCTGCPYLVVEKLNGEEAEIFGTSELESCDCDKIALDAAELLEAYRSTNHTPEECAAAFKDLAAYRAAEQDGTRLWLPCKPGDDVWFIRFAYSFAPSPVKAKITRVRGVELNNEIMYSALLHGTGASKTFSSANIGKTVFLTREAAEAALKEQEGQK